MADALKRIARTKELSFQDRCAYYMYQKAAVIFSDENPDPDDLLLAKALWANQVKHIDMARIVITNDSIGAKIDNGEKINPEDETLTDPVLDSQIEWVIYSDDTGAKGFHQLALAYKSAGLLGV